MCLTERGPLTPVSYWTVCGDCQRAGSVVFIPALRAVLPPAAPSGSLEHSLTGLWSASSTVLATRGTFQGWVFFFLLHGRTRNKAERILGSLGFTVQDVSVLASSEQCLLIGYMIRLGWGPGQWIRGVSFYSLCSLFAHPSDGALCHLVAHRKSHCNSKECNNSPPTQQDVFKMYVSSIHSNIHSQEGQESTARQCDLRPGDGVLLPSVPGLHQCSQSRRMYFRHDAAPQRAPHVHARGVRRGAAAPTSGEIPQQTQGGEAGCSQIEG